MANWRKVLTHFVADVEEGFDRMKYGLGERLGRRDPIMIRAYRGFGSQNLLYLKGRVLEDEGIPPVGDNDNLWDNLLNMYRRFESDEIPYARIRARYGQVEQEVTADEEGYFEIRLVPSAPLPVDQLWHTVKLELLYPTDPGQEPIRCDGEVFVPPPGAQFGVISDIDDTVLQTDAAHLLRMARNVFLGNARTRLPFKGVAAFYRALFEGYRGETPPAQGAGQAAVNPLFYISSSPWNLYGLLSEFFNLQEIPIGPILFLRDWGISQEELLPTGHRKHKLASIKTVLETYPDLGFILIGDSGQEDPEIYAEAVEQYPQRIQAIYIRNVSRNLKRPEAIQELGKKVAEAGVTLILADDTVPMARHAIEQGWIAPEALAQIEERKQEDEAPLNPVEELLGTDPAKKAEAPTVVVDGTRTDVTPEKVEAGMIDEQLQKPS